MELNKKFEAGWKLKQVNPDFLHNLTHEFLTPLSVISLNLQILEMLEENQGDQNGKKSKHLQTIKNQVLRLNEVVNDSIDLLKLDTLNEEIVSKETDIIELMEAIVSSVGMCKHELLYRNHIDERELIIKTDQRLLRTCIFRLVNHACITFRKKVPELILKKQGGKLLIMVINHEISLDPEDMDHIFKPFQRTTEMEKIEGMSLALTIIRTRLKFMGAEFSVIPLSALGIKYTIELPIGS